MPVGQGQDANARAAMFLLRCCSFIVAFALGFMVSVPSPATLAHIPAQAQVSWFDTAPILWQKANVYKIKKETTLWPQYVELSIFLAVLAILRLTLMLIKCPAGESPQEQPASDATQDVQNTEEQNADSGCFASHCARAGPAAPLLALVAEIGLGYLLGFAILAVVDFIQSILFRGESAAKDGFLSSLDIIIGICVIVALWAIFWLLMTAPQGEPLTPRPIFVFNSMHIFPAPFFLSPIGKSTVREREQQLHGIVSSVSLCQKRVNILGLSENLPRHPQAKQMSKLRGEGRIEEDRGRCPSSPGLGFRV